jgi:transposase
MGKKNAKRYDPAFKARVAMEAAQGQETLAQIGHRYGVHPVVVCQWKKQLLERASEAFRREGGNGDAERTRDELLKKIGELTVERDFLARGLRRSR